MHFRERVAAYSYAFRYFTWCMDGSLWLAAHVGVSTTPPPLARQFRAYFVAERIVRAGNSATASRQRVYESLWMFWLWAGKSLFTCSSKNTNFSIVRFCSASPSLVLTPTTSYSTHRVPSSAVFVRCILQVHSSGACISCIHKVPSSGALGRCLHQLHSSGALISCIRQVHSSGAFIRCTRQVPSSGAFPRCTTSPNPPAGIIVLIILSTQLNLSAALRQKSLQVRLSDVFWVALQMHHPQLLRQRLSWSPCPSCTPQYQRPCKCRSSCSILVKYFISSFRLNKLIITVNYVFHYLCYVNRLGWCTYWVMSYKFMES